MGHSEVGSRTTDSLPQAICSRTPAFWNVEAIALPVDIVQRQRRDFSTTHPYVAISTRTA